MKPCCLKILACYEVLGGCSLNKNIVLLSSIGTSSMAGSGTFSAPLWLVEADLTFLHLKRRKSHAHSAAIQVHLFLISSSSGVLPPWVGQGLNKF